MGGQVRPLDGSVFSAIVLSTLDACRAALCKSAHLLNRRHACVPRKRSQERAVGPAKFERFLWRFAGKQSIEKARGKTIAATYTIMHVKIAGYGCVGLTANPGHGSPTM